MQRYHGYRYFDWRLRAGLLEFSESEAHLEREKKIEGKYIIATGEKGLSVLDAVALYKDLTEVEHVSKPAAAGAPSQARPAGGGTPSRRTAAVSVVISQWPWGTGPSTRTPPGARPWVRSIAVAAADSATKTNRAGSIAANSWRHA
jgi:hypothetical protein